MSCFILGYLVYTLGMEYGSLAQILFEKALTYNIFSVKVPENQAHSGRKFPNFQHKYLAYISL